MRKTITAALLIALGTVSFAQTYYYQKYIPTQLGNTWKYSNQSSSKIDYKYYSWAHFDYFLGTEDIWGKWVGNKFYIYPDENGNTAMALNFAASTGVPYSTSAFPGAKVTILSKNDTAVTPAGVFTGCVVFSIEHPGVYDAGYEVYTFAKYVGLVKIVHDSIAGPQSIYLTYAKINGVTYGSNSPIVGSVSPSNVYVNASATGFTFDVDYTVTNTSTTSKSLTFNTGKQYDLKVYNASGAVVYTWSANKYFIQVIGTMTLAAGESKTFQIHNVTNLPTGSYAYRAFLTPNIGEVAGTMGQLYVAPQFEPLAGALDPNALMVGGPAIPGAQWTVNYSVTNNSGANTTLNFNSGQQFDAVIYDSNGSEYWKWSTGKYFIMALTAQTWAAGETKTFTLQIDKPGGLGNYTLKVYMLPEKAVATAPITVLP